jgi:hypothetical protein
MVNRYIAAGIVSTLIPFCLSAMILLDRPSILGIGPTQVLTASFAFAFIGFLYLLVAIIIIVVISQVSKAPTNAADDRDHETRRTR